MNKSVKRMGEIILLSRSKSYLINSGCRANLKTKSFSQMFIIIDIQLLNNTPDYFNIVQRFFYFSESLIIAILESGSLACNLEKHSAKLLWPSDQCTTLKNIVKLFLMYLRRRIRNKLNTQNMEKKRYL